MTNDQLPIPNSQLPIPNYQFPITNSQLPITNYPLPITHYPLPIPMHNDLKVGKFIVFQIASYHWALPISDVLKVVNCSTLIDKELRTLGIVQLGHHVIKILDLQPLNSDKLSELSNTQTFLVITRNAQGELCGIAVESPPNLIELPLEMIRSFPQSDSYSKCFDWVSHVVVISPAQVSTTIFLLDVRRINTTRNDLQALAIKSTALTV
jgi:chemotaxis signal transduction protein